MTTLFCFSGSGHSRSVAEYLSSSLDIAIQTIRHDADYQLDADMAIIVFPVYNQNIPSQVKTLLPRIRACKYALVATYGHISPGNVLYEASRMMHGTAVGAFAIATGHTYLSEGNCWQEEHLRAVVTALQAQSPVEVKKRRKNPFADLLPEWRSRMGVSIQKGDGCTQCGICTRECPIGAMTEGKPNNKCIRCMRCVSVCPHHCLKFRLGFWLRLYLKRAL